MLHMASMNYFDANRKKSSIFFEGEVNNGNVYQNPLTFMFTVVFLNRLKNCAKIKLLTFSKLIAF